MERKKLFDEAEQKQKQQRLSQDKVRNVIKRLEKQIQDFERDSRLDRESKFYAAAEKTAPRSISLGEDRHFRSYYWHPENGGRVFIEEPEFKEPEQKPDGTVEYPISPYAKKGNVASEWTILDTEDLLDHLIMWLDERGVREEKLKTNILARKGDIVKSMRRQGKGTNQTTIRRSGRAKKAGLTGLKGWTNKYA